MIYVNLNKKIVIKKNFFINCLFGNAITYQISAESIFC